MEKNRSVFENMTRIAATLVNTFGKQCEVAIHDFSKLPNSLFHIEGTITRRKPGAPITDLVLRAIRAEGDQVKDICNYKTITKEGRVLKSSTTFVRNGNGKVIGAFCVNFDITDYLNTMGLINEFTRLEIDQNSGHKETFATTLNETIESVVDKVVNRAGKQPATMSRAEKIDLVETLELEGAFLVKGTVDYVANYLGVTNFTVYNYLKAVRSRQENKP